MDVFIVSCRAFQLPLSEAVLSPRVVEMLIKLFNVTVESLISYFEIFIIVNTLELSRITSAIPKCSL